VLPTKKVPVKGERYKDADSPSAKTGQAPLKKIIHIAIGISQNRFTFF